MSFILYFFSPKQTTAPAVVTVPGNYVAEDGVTFYVAEDGATFYIQES